ncbi:hypothetical protein BGZ98_004660 [Dissophora globulifera]|nr:hypothetical protein BGZ98_004660 [Dissophora globulifera]
MTTPKQEQRHGLRFSLRNIAFSHFCEKARWTLDYYGVPYVEYRSLPWMHIISMFRHRATTVAGPECSPFSTPFLTCTPEDSTADATGGRTIKLNDSTDILGFISDQFAAPSDNSTIDASVNLYSDDAATKAKILALEERFDQMIGPHVRRTAYYEIFVKAPRSVQRELGHHNNAGKLQSWLWSMFVPLWGWLIIKFFNINEVSAARSMDILKREFEHISHVLESNPTGSGYLVGSQFTAADLTLASLASIVLGVTHKEGYGAWLPPMTVMRPEGQAFCEELRQTTAGKHVLRCYQQHRGEKPPGSSYGYMFFGLW